MRNFGLLAAAGMLLMGSPVRFTALEPIVINDNRNPAGTLRDGVLTIHLDVRAGDWRVDGDGKPGLEVLAFAEQGRAPQVPGPLIRVPEGTEIHATVRNTLSSGTLTVHGLYARDAGNDADTILVAAGKVREVRFKAGKPGTYYYWASTGRTLPNLGREGRDSQLSGALIIDPRNAQAPSDRVFLLSFWNDTLRAIPGGAGEPQMIRFAINGRSWPATERLEYTLGDTIHWRIISPNNQPHPMHLHGFYFRVDSRGDERTDSVFDASSAPRFAVTERVAPGRTMSMTWIPERPGNWLFHCHDNVHIMKHTPLEGPGSPQPSQIHDVQNHTDEMMAGLVMGVHVRPKAGGAASTDARGARRRLRLIVRQHASPDAAQPAFGFVLDDTRNAQPSTPAPLPGPSIILKRGEPVAITVVNQLSEPTSVHWHGIELESYFDGVPGFAGSAGRIAPAIAPRDSFEARFTPPRSGTFIYHTHVDEMRQQRAGLSGPLLIVDDPATYDPATDKVLLISTPRNTEDQNVVLMNGSTTPAPLELRAGTRYRLRVINIHTYRPSMNVQIRQGSELVTWRALAKDGADLPPALSTVRPASQITGNGETFDFAFLPSAAGELTLSVVASNGDQLLTMSVLVR
jgi:FtsP/CotA-like multicopper oxidase with cupredoxin domain